MGAGILKIKIIGDADQFHKTLSNTSGGLSTFAKGAGLAAGAVVAGFVTLASQAISTADEIQNLADRTGLSAERLQELKYVGDDLGVELDTIAGAQAKLTKAMDAGREGTGKQAEAFKTLGVNITDSNGNLRDAKTVMMEAFDALGSVGNETERDALAMAIFGKSAQQLNPLIAAGSDELNRLSGEARKNGSVMSNEAIAGLDAFGDTMEHLKSAVLGKVGELFGKIAPKIAEVVKAISSFDWPGWSGVVDKIGSAFGRLSTPLQAVAIFCGTAAAAAGIYAAALGVMAIATAAVSAAQTIALVAMYAWGAACAIATSPVTLIVVAIAALAAIAFVVYKNWEPISQFFIDLWETIKGAFITAWDAIKNALSAAWDFIKSTAETVWNAIKQFFMDWWPLIIGIFMGPLGILAGMIYKFHDEIYAAILVAWEKIKGAFSAAWDAIQSAFDTAWGALKGAFNTVLTFFVETGTKIKDFFLAIPGYVTSGLAGLWSAFTGPFKTAWDWINTNIVQPAKAFFNWLAGQKAANANDPAAQGIMSSHAVPHALGGLFTSPHVGLVAEAGPELILPLRNQSRTNQLLSQAGLSQGNIGGGNTFNFYGVKDMEDGADKFLKRCITAGVTFA